MTTTTLPADPTEVSPEVLADVHERMVRIRTFEMEAGRLSEAGELPGFLHLYVGQEAVAAGVMSTLHDTDQITSTHRGHGHAVAKGADLKRMYAELYGRVDGYCHGHGGSMHINDLDIGMLGANGIVGAGIPIAVGAAFASKYRGDGGVVATFFGDGASNIGAFHEGANMAAILRLPVVLVCENNGYAEFTSQERHMLPKDVADRAASYGMPGVVVDGMDAVAVHLAAKEAVERARSGGGPTLLEAKTYRYYDHQGVKGLRIPYREESEVEQWRGRDAIEALERRALEAGVLSQDQIDEVHRRIEAEVAEAIEFGANSPHPQESDLLRNVYTVK